jgi:hypothetical protein
MVYAENRFLTKEEMTVNAEYILSFLLSRGWTKNSVAGMLGNMETESTINPAIWQSLDYGNMSGGFGLVQWTPASKYTDWADSNGYAWENIDGQLTRLQYEIDNGLQWIETSDYPISFQEFKVSSETPEYLAQAFLRNYERPADQTQPDRSTQARYWYDTLTGEGSTGGTQLAVFLMDMIHITQGENGSYSHTGTLAIDFVGTHDMYPLYAPCDVECIHRDDTNAILGWKSQKPVMCADGNIRNIMFRVIHDCNPLFNVGDKTTKKTLFGHTGICGNVTGDHLHLDVWEATEYNDRSKPLHIYDVFAVNGVTIVEGLGYPWKTSDYVDGNPSTETPSNKNNQLIKMLLADTLNGWKW